MEYRVIKPNVLAIITQMLVLLVKAHVLCGRSM